MLSLTHNLCNNNKTCHICSPGRKKETTQKMSTGMRKPITPHVQLLSQMIRSINSAELLTTIWEELKTMKCCSSSGYTDFKTVYCKDCRHGGMALNHKHVILPVWVTAPPTCRTCDKPLGTVKSGVNCTECILQVWREKTVAIRVDHDPPMIESMYPDILLVTPPLKRRPPITLERPNPLNKRKTPLDPTNSAQASDTNAILKNMLGQYPKFTQKTYTPSPDHPLTPSYHISSPSILPTESVPNLSYGTPSLNPTCCVQMKRKGCSFVRCCPTFEIPPPPLTPMTPLAPPVTSILMTPSIMTSTITTPPIITSTATTPTMMTPSIVVDGIPVSSENPKFTTPDIPLNLTPEKSTSTNN